MAKAKKAQPKSDYDRDKEYILKYDSWWRWPFCPVKRRNRSMEDKNLGVLLATEEHAAGKMIVYHGNMWRWPDYTPEQIKALPKTEYASVDDLLADGWEVD